MQGAVESDIREGHAKTRKGWLSKNDSSGKNWKKRYFTLGADVIRYYNSDKDMALGIEHCKGAIPITVRTQIKAQIILPTLEYALVCNGEQTFFGLRSGECVRCGARLMMLRVISNKIELEEIRCAFIEQRKMVRCRCRMPADTTG